jgi:hypothetical protein
MTTSVDVRPWDARLSHPSPDPSFSNLAEVLHRTRLLAALSPHLAPHPQASPDGLHLLANEPEDGQ